MALDYEVKEHVPNQRGDGARFLRVEFRPTPGDIAVLGRGGVHSNQFWMQIPATGSRVVMDNGQLVTRSGRRVAPDAEGQFPAEDGRDPWRIEEFTRDVAAEYEANVKAYYERKLRSASEGRPYPQRHRTTLNLQVAASSDDAHQVATPATVTNGTTTSTIDATNEWAGFRWLNITIPQGALINAAVFSTVPVGSLADEPNHPMYMEDSDSPVTFNAANPTDISSRPRTTATVTWASADLGVIDGNTTFYSAPDIAALVQEVINRGGWVSGNAMALVLHGAADANRDLQIRTYDSDTALGSKLDIDFTVGAGASSVAKILQQMGA